MTTAMWIGLAWWDFTLAMATFGLYCWSSVFALRATRYAATERGRIFQVLLWAARGLAAGCVALLVLMTIVATSDAF